MGLAETDNSVKVVHYSTNRGKGHAIRQGFLASSGDLILCMDADMGPMVHNIKKFIDVLANGADVVVGSKRHPSSRVRYPIYRRFLSAGFNSLVRLFFGLPLADSQAGFKLYKREVLETVLPKLLMKRFAFEVEMMANVSRKGFNVVEAPIVYTHEGSHLTVGDVFWMGVDLIAIFYRMHMTDTYR